jgi:hypothetical protein
LNNNEEKLKEAEVRMKIAETSATSSNEKVKSAEEMLKRNVEKLDQVEDKLRKESVLVEKLQDQVIQLTKSERELKVKLEESGSSILFYLFYLLQLLSNFVEVFTKKNVHYISQLEATTTTLEIEKNKAKNLAQLTLSTIEKEKSNV